MLPDRRNEGPGGAVNVRCVVLGRPAVGRQHHLVLVPIQPCAPPRAGAVANNIVVAETHQQHILPAILARVPVNEHRILEWDVRATPSGIVGENVESCLAIQRLHLLDGALVVGQAAHLPQIVNKLGLLIITAVYVQAHCVCILLNGAGHRLGLGVYL